LNGRQREGGKKEQEFVGEGVIFQKESKIKRGVIGEGYQLKRFTSEKVLGRRSLLGENHSWRENQYLMRGGVL